MGFFYKHTIKIRVGLVRISVLESLRLVMHIRPREFFLEIKGLVFSENLGKNLIGVAISDHLERISPGPTHVKVGHHIA